jgi:hypothetical protein
MQINFYDASFFTVNSKVFNYVDTLSHKLSTVQFRGYFTKTMSLYPKYRLKLLSNGIEVYDYYRRCHLISILQLMGMISKSLPQFRGSIGLMKIGNDKDGNKNYCVIDDSTVLDNGIIRDSDGSLGEPHRGHRLFYSLPFDYGEDVIIVLDYMLGVLSNIFDNIKNNQNMNFDPILMIQRIVQYCLANDMYDLINYLAWEVHNEPHLLSQSERIDLFTSYEDLKSKWNSGYITDNQGKFRILILCIYYLQLVSNGNIVENF